MTKKIKTYQVDLGFYSIEYIVKAKTKSEARKKAIEKAKKGLSKIINKNTTYVDKLDD